MHIQGWTVPLKKIIALKARCLKPCFGRYTRSQVWTKEIVTAITARITCHDYLWSFWFYVWNMIFMFTFQERKVVFFLIPLKISCTHMSYGMHYRNLSSVLFKNNISWCYVTYDLHLFWGTVVLLSSLDMMNICKSFSDILTVLHIHSHKPIVSHH